MQKVAGRVIVSVNIVQEIKKTIIYMHLRSLALGRQIRLRLLWRT